MGSSSVILRPIASVTGMIKYSIFAGIVSLGLCQAETWWYSDELDRTPQFDKKYYHLGSEMMDWTNARQYCTDKGAMLWCPRSKDENDLVWFNLQGDIGFPDVGTTWTGIRRDDEADRHDPNSWKCDCGGSETMDGECPSNLGGGHKSIDYTQWQMGEPNNHEGKNEACIMTHWFSENWHDIRCETDKGRPLCMTVNPPEGAFRELERSAIEENRGHLGFKRLLLFILFLCAATSWCFVCYCFCCCCCKPCKMAIENKRNAQEEVPVSSPASADPFQTSQPQSTGPVGNVNPLLNPVGYNIEQLNAELNSTARNTNDVAKIRELVGQGADLLSTNGHPWHHTPLHQACIFGRVDSAKALIELLKKAGKLDTNLQMGSNTMGHLWPMWNSCCHGGTGKPMEFANMEIRVLLEG